MTHDQSVLPLASEPPPAATLRFPLSSAQERCWFINALDPGTTALNVALRWELRGRIDKDTVEDSFAAIVARHEILRTRIVEDDGTPIQEVRPFFRPVVSEIDLSGLSEQRRTDEALRIGRQEAHKPFDPSDLPLLRISLLRMAPEQAFLLLTLHQIAFDGWSIRLISREFGLTMAALRSGRRPDLPVLPLQYGDYAAWQAAFFASRHFDREIAYWTSRLRDAPYFEVPGDRPRGARPTVHGDILAMLLPDDLEAAMLRKVKAEGVTPFGFGCAVIAATLQRRTGAEDISIATQVGGREDPDLEPLIGVFINNLVLRFDLSGQPSFGEVLARANRTVQEALIHQAVPFHRLVGLLKPPRDPSRMPLVSVNFTVLQDVMENARYGDLDLIGHPSLSAGSLYDLNFFLVHWSTGWRMAVEYNPDLFDRSTGEALLALWRETFEDALGDRLRRPQSRDRADLPAPPTPDPREAALSRHALVSEAVVVQRPVPGGSTALHAFVTLAPGYAGVVESVAPLLLNHLLEDERSDAPLSGINVMMTLPRGREGRIDRAALASLPLPSWAPIASRDPASRASLLEALLAPLWSEMLDGTPVTPDSSFFEIGGHSLLALRMLARLPGLTGLRPSVSTLFLAPTLRGFAAELARLDGAQASITVPTSPSSDGAVPDPDAWRRIQVRPPSSAATIFGIDSMEELVEFAAERGGNHGLYAIQLFEAGRPNPFRDRSFEAIAADYYTVIRQVQPHGPYILFGLCVHGVLAFEIAQQMRQAGEEVELLAFKQAWHPAYARRLSRLNRWVVRLSQVRDNFALVLAGRKTFVSFLGNYSLVQRSRVLHIAARLKLLKRVPSRTGSEVNDEFLLALMDARDRYDPKPYDGRVLQVVGRDAPRGRGFDRTLGWIGTITGPFTIIDRETEETTEARGGRLVSSDTLIEQQAAN